MLDTTGNMDLFVSTTPDDGMGAGALTVDPLHSFVNDYVHNRALAPLGAGQMLAVWSIADMTPNITGLSWASSTAGWAPNAAIFPAPRPMAINDWAVCGTNTTTA